MRPQVIIPEMLYCPRHEFKTDITCYYMYRSYSVFGAVEFPAFLC